VLGLAVFALLPLYGASGAGAVENVEQEATAAARLADKFAPITMLREQQDPPCDTDEEQYEPTSVDTVLGNPTVTLQELVPGEGLVDVKKAPTAEDIAGLGEDHYLNLDGAALGDTCIYSKDFRKLVEEGNAPAVTYAHIAREGDHEGFVLQYWFFWYFNQFNDLHEGDWEGMQISFDSEGPAAALEAEEEPDEIILFQHAGGERADWDDSNVQKEGTRPIVYPAAGSHATFYDSAVYVENGQEGSGLGCDNTSEPVRELRLRPILLPNDVPSTGPFVWLGYGGRWGEREKGYNNGPTGPPTKTVWREPFTWMADQRSTSPRLPVGSIVGPQVTGAFCGVVEAASEVINVNNKSRLGAILTIAIPLLLLALFVGLTRWGPIDLERLRARRSFGQILRTARQLYGRHWLILVPIALTALVIVGGTNFIADQFFGGSGGLDDAAGRGGVNLALGDTIKGFALPVAQAIVAAMAIVLVRSLVESQPASLGGSVRGLRERIWRVVGAQLMATIGIILLFLSIVGIPFAIYKLVAWAFVQQEVLFTDKKIRDAFRGSSDLVRGRWWHTVRVVVFLTLLSVSAGPILSFALIFTTLPLFWTNLLGALVFSLLIPYAATANTLLYFDLGARAETEGIKARRSWKVWRPRQFGRVVRRDPAPQTATG
jgi:hypothetical protein